VSWLTSVTKVSTSGRLCGFSGIDQIVDDQRAFAVPVSLDRFEDRQFALRLMVIGRHTDRIDEPHFKFAGHNGGRNQSTACDGDNPLQGFLFGETPGQGAGIAVELFPGDGEIEL
jgi:hypothetical protein